MARGVSDVVTIGLSIGGSAANQSVSLSPKLSQSSIPVSATIKKIPYSRSRWPCRGKGSLAIGDLLYNELCGSQ